MSNPKLSGIVQSAPNKSVEFDADSQISLAMAQRFHGQGYKFCIRYVSLGAESPGDLDYEEASAILEGGLALMPVQHVSEPGWFPNAGLGKNHGENAAVNTDRVGFPVKVNVWCDLEGISPSATAQDVIDYCNAWYDSVDTWGYIPGLYVGANSILDGEQLYSLKFQHFWKSESYVPEVEIRSYQMVQSPVSEPVNGIGIDRDITYIDDKGGRPQWLINPRFA
ncbi:MAG: DUF1906 domain-containing protein [Cyanobacteria bacterium P01_G01_bin.54]